jgi:hypothetical protein
MTSRQSPVFRQGWERGNASRVGEAPERHGVERPLPEAGRGGELVLDPGLVWPEPG